jgi:hypothetical protein
MGDNPNLACDNHHDLEMDDIIIVATDGYSFYYKLDYGII